MLPTVATAGVVLAQLPPISNPVLASPTSYIPHTEMTLEGAGSFLKKRKKSYKQRVKNKYEALQDSL